MIEVNGVIYRNLEEQVQKNKEDINTTNQNVSQNTNSINEINTKLNNLDLTYATDEDIQNLQSQINTKADQGSLNTTNQTVSQNTSKISSIETTLTEITPDVMRALKTPISAPNETKIVAVDNTNSQEMIGIGAGLVIENNTLKSTGGTEIIDNLTSSSISAGLSANQGRILDNKITNLTQNVSQNTSNISTINGQISNLDSQISTNTEDIEFLQSDVAGKTNVTINNVHQDYVNFSSDPQTQINNIPLGIYPIGSIYLSINNLSPAGLFGGSWEALPEGYSLQTTNNNAGNIISPGLPNITGSINNVWACTTFDQQPTSTGSLSLGSQITNGSAGGNGWQMYLKPLNLNASTSNSIYGNSTTVQPPAYTIYAWKRIS